MKSGGYGFGSLQDMLRRARSQVGNQAANDIFGIGRSGTDRATAAATQTAPQLTTTPQQVTAAKEIVEKPAPLQNISAMPEYGAATQKTVMDPNYYAQKWNTAADQIGEQYYKKGGYYDRMMEALNARGLSTSGEANFQTREMGRDLAKELATARAGIESERMGHQYAADEAYRQGMANLLGVRGGQDITQQGMDWAYSQAVPYWASNIAGEQNQLIGDEYNRALAEELARAQFGQSQLSDLFSWGGQWNMPTSDQDLMANLLGYPYQEQAAPATQSGYTPYGGGTMPGWDPEAYNRYIAAIRNAGGSPVNNLATNLAKAYMGY